MEARISILAYALKYANDWNLINSAIQNKEPIEDIFIEEAQHFTGNYITIVDNEYPNRLKQKYKPPFVLYYSGDLSLLRHVDDNGGRNNLVFLHGPNTLRIPSNRLCVITCDNKIDICGGLRVWFNCESTNVDRFGLAAGLCQNIVGTKIYQENSHSWFVGITIPNALQMGGSVYMVATTEPSYNNRLIKDRCHLIDCYADILFNSPSGDMPF